MKTDPVCWFEVGDFLDYMRKHPNPSGIQRVEREVLTRLEIDYVSSGRAAACRLDRLTHEFEPVDLSYMLDPTVNWMQWQAEPQRQTLSRMAERVLGVLNTRKWAPRHEVPFTEGDVIVSLGGAWHDHRYPEVVGHLRREKGVRVALLLHDIIPLTHSEWVVPTLAKGFRSWVGKMAEIADLVFTSSQHVRHEYLAYIGREKLRRPPIEILRFGSGFMTWNPGAAGQIPPPSLPEPYALFVSTIEFRKNHRLLIEVWRRLIERHGWDAVPHLLFVGRSAFGAEAVMRQLEESRLLDGKIRVVTDLSDADLQHAYQSCRITLFPSLVEGWGIPVTESLTYGKLCVASNRTSIPEAGGDLVDYFDPDDTEDALGKIERALFDSRYLLMREEDIRSKFSKISWNIYTDDMMRALRRLSSSPVGVQTTPGETNAAAQISDVVVRVAQPRSAQRKRILVLKLDHLGDFILAVQALRKLRDEFRQAEITLICGSWNKAFAENLGIFDRVLTHDYQPRNARIQNAPPLESMTHFDSLPSGTYDIAIDLKVDADSRVFLTRVDAAAKCGFGSVDQFPYLNVALPLAAGRVAVPETAPAKYEFAPVDFFSRVPGNGLFLETDFTYTDLCIVYGPYVALPSGDYVARFYVTAVRLRSLALMSSITFDVARDEKRLASVQISRLRGQSDLKRGVIEIPFSSDGPDCLFEFRVATKGRPYTGSLRFFGVTVEEVSNRPNSASPPHSDRLHVSELASLLVQLVVDRLGPPRRTVQMATQCRVGTAKADLEAFLHLDGSILIAPFSNKATRDWPLSHYEDLIDLIVARFDNPVGLLGAAEHLDALNEIVRRKSVDRLYNLAGSTEWSELPSVFEKACVVVSNNSGIAHFAAACGVPLIAIYSGAVLAEEWGPRGENTIVTLTANVPCSPCGYDRLEQCSYDHRCMRHISAERVFAELSKLLEAASQAR